MLAARLSTIFARASRSTLTITKRRLNLAVILGEMRRADEAIDECRQCMALQPSNSEAYAVLGNVLRVAQNNVEAAAAYSDSLRLKPAQPDVLARLGELLSASARSRSKHLHIAAGRSKSIQATKRHGRSSAAPAAAAWIRLRRCSSSPQ